MESLEPSEESLSAPAGPVAHRSSPGHLIDTLLEVAVTHASLSQVRGDSYAELIIAADGIAATGRTQPVVMLRLGTEFRGIAFAGH